ncbi:hypothetical protein BPNPMPFG_005458 [Mesorhizobium sp. AR07]|uniref:tetratricopeptide repeat protein n=1 Tax=Mesorhizobium sp. AR07 TaxID=2865838 RepID=UPI002160E1F3|nr:hypothetical protein [Mesorhizobium sp. AR07]UVK43644.1 hypothetical protein BPNPMPFG_005458 [Mesorhizobium sp. AR07]
MEHTDFLSGTNADPLLLSALVGLQNSGHRSGWIDPDKISIAVLPFRNLSSGTGQEFFSDGLTEDLITELSRFKDLFIVSWNSASQFKDKPTPAEEIGRQLGVQYLLEGSVRRNGNQVRVTSQLVQARNGVHLWAERYDRTIDDLFAVQDELVQSISSVIPGHVERINLQEFRKGPTEVSSAYLCELQGRWTSRHTANGLGTAISWYEKAISLDADFGVAHAGLAELYAYSVFVLSDPPETRFPKALDHIGKALSLDDLHPHVQHRAALVFTMTGSLDVAEKHAKQAVLLSPNDPRVLQAMGVVMTYRGRLDEAISWFARSEKIEPYAADDARLDTLCDAFFMRKEYEKIVKICGSYQQVPAHQYPALAAAEAQLGREERAQQAMARYECIKPPSHNAAVMARLHANLCERPEDREHWLEGYTKAGVLKG